jgi:hypothetical protein
MGRKSISGERKTDRTLRIRLTDGEREALDAAAAAAGLKTSSWARGLLLAASGVGPKERTRKPRGVG